ncbi:MAG: PIG-L deacetylase family protein [Longimicrobiales bacterium]
MMRLTFDRAAAAGLQVLCLGAHPDDIEIGCGGSILNLLAHRSDVTVRWVVFSGSAERAREAQRSADLFLDRARSREVIVHSFRDGYFPSLIEPIKDHFEELKGGPAPHLIFTHAAHDRHQDHRVISELTWNTFRDHLILEYEIPKYDGDLVPPNAYVPLADEERALKVGHLMECFVTQRDKHWFAPETFDGLMRLRGLECASATGYAEAFHARKLVLGAA